MRALLDTEVWVWMLASPELLSPRSAALISSLDNELVFSAVSAWEIAIKSELGKLRLPRPLEEAIPALMSRTGVTALPILHRHALHVATLPAKHRDPFDRLLIAQAQLEELPVLTSDRRFTLYDVEVLPA